MTERSPQSPGSEEFVKEVVIPDVENDSPEKIPAEGVEVETAPEGTGNQPTKEFKKIKGGSKTTRTSVEDFLAAHPTSTKTGVETKTAHPTPTKTRVENKTALEVVDNIVHRLMLAIDGRDGGGKRVAELISNLILGLDLDTRYEDLTSDQQQAVFKMDGQKKEDIILFRAKQYLDNLNKSQ